MYGIEDKLLAIAYSLLMLLLAGGIRVVAGTFLIPAGLFALAWFAFTLLPLVFLFSVPINSLAILYILAAVCVFSLSALPFDWQGGLRRNLTKSLPTAGFDSLFLKVVLYLSAMASASLSVVTMLINGFTIEQVMFDLLRTSGQYATVRGMVGLEYGIIGILNTMFTYLCPVLGGLRALAPRRKWFFVVSMAPSVFKMVIASSKLVFLVSLCFYLSGALIARIYAKQMSLPKVSGLPKMILGAAILIPLVLVSFVSRFAGFDLDNLGAIADPLLYDVRSYTLGQTYAFADFFSHTIGYPCATFYNDDFHSYGSYTFFPILDMLGIGKDATLIYEESGWYKDLFETNIFTFFRGLIDDFGVVGSLLFMLVFGTFAHAVTYRILTRARAWFALAVFNTIVVFILMGYLVSVFSARYAFLTAAVTWLLLNLNERLYRTNNSRADRYPAKT
jgi:oligosaccharide repeat unit polymerase